jgi:hypothetical protein
VSGLECKIEIFHNRREHKRRFLQGEARSDALAWADAEWEIGEPINS